MLIWICYDVIIIKLTEWGTAAVDILFVIEVAQVGHGFFYLQDDGRLLHHCICQCVVIYSI